MDRIELFVVHVAELMLLAVFLVEVGVHAYREIRAMLASVRKDDDKRRDSRRD